MARKKSDYMMQIKSAITPDIANPTDATSRHFSLRSLGSRYFFPNLMASMVLGVGFPQNVFIPDLSIGSVLIACLNS